MTTTLFPRRLPQDATGYQLEEFAEGLAARTPDEDVSFGWLCETLLALPLPFPSEKKENLDPLARHAVIAYKIGRLRSMLAWTTEDVRDFGYWQSPKVRQGLADTAEALQRTLAALKAEADLDAQLFTSLEEKAVQFYYDEAAGAFT